MLLGENLHLKGSADVGALATVCRVGGLNIVMRPKGACLFKTYGSPPRKLSQLG